MKIAKIIVIPRARPVKQGSARQALRFTLCTSLVLLIVVSGSSSNSVAKELASGTITIDLSGLPISKFRPDATFGAALDGKEQGELNQIYTPENLRKMRSAGLRKITSRLRTELGIEAWHWSEQGTWSDAQHRQGYWVSSDAQEQHVLISHGYRLPRRGNTTDQAEDDGYSRLTDGDTSTFWKSNPYLDKHYTNDEQEARPQWVLVDFGNLQNINAAKILWGKPYAKEFEVQYWVSDISDFAVTDDGEWHRYRPGQAAAAPRRQRQLGLLASARLDRLSRKAPPNLLRLCLWYRR